MKLVFNKVTLHNFGSYSHSEVDLKDKGFCSVTGENHFAKDNALSNGSGKSFLWSAICYTLTGETIGGLTKNLKNINTTEDDGYTMLDFNVDNDNFVITRIFSPKSNLRIIKNGNDISGKGITESKDILASELPDITKDLVASTIIIGQGMPNKFSSFTPAGRKELLERLTKSDYMIDDIKTRIANRQVELNTKNREYEDSILINNTKLTSLKADFDKISKELENAVKPDFDSDITKYSTDITTLENNINTSTQYVTEYENKLELASEEVLKLTASKGDLVSEMMANYNEKKNKLLEEKLAIQSSINSLETDIKSKKSIRTTCPTCGQKLIGVFKPDTTALEEELKQKQAELFNKHGELDTCEVNRDLYAAQINDSYDAQISNAKSKQTALQARLREEKSILSAAQSNLNNINILLSKAQYEKQNWDNYYNGLLSHKSATAKAISEIENTINISNIGKLELNEHIAVVKKIDTFVKRDFRSYLLYNIIEYLNRKAKEYSKIVFGTEELELAVNGNNLDISYCGKLIDNLSGGEKQRVDLILQFVIRDMLTMYLNYSSNIIVLDEIFDNLDKIATDRILALITEKLKDIESIFIISHHSEELDLPIDSEIKIIKNEQGISEVK